MAQQMINERTFSTESIGELSGGTPVSHRMSVGGTVFKSLVLFVVTCGFAAVGWSRAGTVIRTTSGPSWLLGYFLDPCDWMPEVGERRLRQHGSPFKRSLVLRPQLSERAQ